LRGNADHSDQDIYRHTGMTLYLREEVIESMLLMNARLAYMSALGALYGNPGADVEKGADQVNKIYYDALSHVPYMLGGESVEDAMMASRMAAIEEYQRMKRAALKVK
jgi:hypothetical protein